MVWGGLSGKYVGEAGSGWLLVETQGHQHPGFLPSALLSTA